MKIPALLLLALAVAFNPVLAREESPTTIPPLNFQHRTLPNGLNIYSVEDHSSPTVAIQIWYHVGSKDDPSGRSGFAHLFEHIMFKGTRDMKPEMLDHLTEDVGGQNNAYTAPDVTVFFETVPSNYLEPLLWAEAERMSSLNVDAANFKSERAVVEEEYRQRVLADPYGEFSLELEKKSFINHPYKRPTIGNMADLDAASLKDVQAFHSTYYRPDNATLVVVGDFDGTQLDEWTQKYFGSIPKPSAPIPRVTVKEPPRKKEARYTSVDPKIPLPALAVTYLAPSVASEDAAAFQIAEEILGDGDSSRLYQSLVYRQQVAQNVSCNADLREDLGLFEFEVIVASGKSTGEAEKSLLAEIEAMKEKPVTDGELAKAKNRILTEKLKERERFEGKSSALANAAVLEGDASRVNTDLDKIQKVTAQDVQRIMRKYTGAANRVVITWTPKPAAKSGGKK